VLDLNSRMTPMATSYFCFFSTIITVSMNFKHITTFTTTLVSDNQGYTLLVLTDS